MSKTDPLITKTDHSKNLFSTVDRCLAFGAMLEWSILTVLIAVSLESAHHYFSKTNPVVFAANLCQFFFGFNSKFKCQSSPGTRFEELYGFIASSR